MIFRISKMPVCEITISMLDGSSQAERAEVRRTQGESSPYAERGAPSTVQHMISCKIRDLTPCCLGFHLKMKSTAVYVCVFINVYKHILETCVSAYTIPQWWWAQPELNILISLEVRDLRIIQGICSDSCLFTSQSRAGLHLIWGGDREVWSHIVSPDH